MTNLDALVSTLTEMGCRVHLVYGTGDITKTDVYLGFHGGRLVLCISWHRDRDILSDLINIATLIHELGHVLAETDPGRLQMPNFGMVRYAQPHAKRGWQTRLNVDEELRTEARAQAWAKAIGQQLGSVNESKAITINPGPSLYGLNFTKEQTIAVIQSMQPELDAIMQDPDVLLKLRAKIAQECARSRAALIGGAR